MLKNALHVHRHDATGRLHPCVYWILTGFVGGWLVLTLTFFLGGSVNGHAYGGLIAPVVAVLGTMAVLIPLTIWRIGQSHPGKRNVARPNDSLHVWLNKELVVWDGHIRGLDAAITVLLPGIAAMLGGLALTVVFHIVAH